MEFSSQKEPILNSETIINSDAPTECIRSKGDFKDCLFKSVIKRFSNKEINVQELYDYLNNLENNNFITIDECYVVAHKLGAYYLHRLGINNIFSDLNYGKDSKDDFVCATGFRHGALIELSKNDNEYNFKKELNVLSKESENLINNTNRMSEKYLEAIQVVHGIGHAIYSRYGELDKTINICKEFGVGKSLTDVCEIGAFMEYSLNLNQFNIENKINFCGDYKNDYLGCMLGYRQSYSFLKKNSKEIFKYCNTLDDVGDFFQCNISFFMQAKQSHLNFNEYCDLSKNKLVCVLAKLYVNKENYVNGKDYSEYVDNKCLELGFFDYLKCKKIYYTNESVLIFMTTQGNNMPKIRDLDISDLIYLFR